MFAGGAVQLVLVPPSVSVRSGLFRAANSSWPESLHTVHIIIPQCKQEPRLPWFIVASSEGGDAETRKRWARGGDQGKEERGREEECRKEEFHAMGTKVESWDRAGNCSLNQGFPRGHWGLTRRYCGQVTRATGMRRIPLQDDPTTRPVLESGVIECYSSSSKSKIPFLSLSLSKGIRKNSRGLHFSIQSDQL